MLDQVVKLFLSPQLVDFELSFKLLLLFDLLLGRLQVPLQIEQEVWLLDHLQSTLQLVVLFHKIDDGFVCVLKLTLGYAHPTTMNRACSTARWRYIPSALPSNRLPCYGLWSTLHALRQVPGYQASADTSFHRPSFLVNGYIADLVALVAHTATSI